MQTITPEKAVERGTYVIILPSLVILVGIPALAYYINLYYYRYSLWLVLPPFIALSLTLSWVYWAWSVIKWKLWAYERVSNLEALKKQAIAANLMYDDDSWFNKTEIKSKADIAKLAEFEKNASGKYLVSFMADELATPESTAFYHRTWEIWFIAVLTLLCFWLGGNYYLHPETYHKGKEIFMGKFVAIPAGLYLLYKFVNRLRKRKRPVLMLSNEGVYIGEADKSFAWHEVVQFTTIKYDKTDYVKITADKEYEIEIEFDATPSQLEHLHKIYRQRYIKKHYQGNNSL